MAALRSVLDILGELTLLSPQNLAPQSGRADVLPVLLDATAQMPARAAGTTSLTPQQVVAAMLTRGDPWFVSGIFSGVYIWHGLARPGVGMPALPSAPAGTIAGIFAGPLPINLSTATPLFWCRIA